MSKSNKRERIERDLARHQIKGWIAHEKASGRLDRALYYENRIEEQVDAMINSRGTGFQMIGLDTYRVSGITRCAMCGRYVAKNGKHDCPNPPKPRSNSSQKGY